jgi:hypothetical protein
MKELTKPQEISFEMDNKQITGVVSLRNDKDLMMVLSTLKFIVDKPNRKNIYKYLRQKIAASGIEKTYRELDEIREVGDKIAAFTIRDIVLMNPNLITKKHLDDAEYEYAFPVDTWVETIAEDFLDFKIDKQLKLDKQEQIKQFLIKKCRENQCDPLKVAAGLWFLGFNSLDLLIDSLKKNKL